MSDFILLLQTNPAVVIQLVNCAFTLIFGGVASWLAHEHLKCRQRTLEVTSGIVVLFAIVISKHDRQRGKILSIANTGNKLAVLGKSCVRVNGTIQKNILERITFLKPNEVLEIELRSRVPYEADIEVFTKCRSSFRAVW